MVILKPLHHSAAIPPSFYQHTPFPFCINHFDDTHVQEYRYYDTNLHHPVQTKSSILRATSIDDAITPCRIVSVLDTSSSSTPDQPCSFVVCVVPPIDDNETGPPKKKLSLASGRRPPYKLSIMSTCKIKIFFQDDDDDEERGRDAVSYVP